MEKALLAVLTDAERLLVLETEPAALAALDEDAVGELHARVRRARNKYVGQYRRGGATKVRGTGGRGKARQQNTTARTKAEAFEQALSRVSRRYAVLAKESAAELKAERLAAARGDKPAGRAAAAPSSSKDTTASATPARKAAAPRAPKPATAKTGDRAVKSPATAKRRAATRATGARRQVTRDSR